MKIKNILLIVVLFLMFLLVVNFVSADCCMQTNDAEYCVTGDSVGNCKEGMFFSEDCEQRTECSNKGACIKDDFCYDGFSEIKCTGGNFEKDKECDDLEGYRNVCCLVSTSGSGGYDFMKENSCIALDGSVDDSVDNEQDCENMNLDPSLRKGCCVKEDGNCVYGLAEDCDGFYQGEFFCSKLETQCNPVCTSHNHKAIGKFDEFNIYWFDSCDNQEELADDCDDLTEMPVQNDKGEWVCGDSSCKKVWDNPYTDENFNGNLKDDNIFYGRSYRLNGESWCEYQQAKVGPGLDMPGTRHYLHSCDHGKEKVDVSGDGRENICIEEQTDGSTGKISKARWLENDPEECFKCNGEDVATEDVQNCCKSQYLSNNVGCSYIERKDISGDNSKILYITPELRSEISSAKSDADEFLMLLYKDIDTGNELYRFDFNKVVKDVSNIIYTCEKNSQGFVTTNCKCVPESCIVSCSSGTQMTNGCIKPNCNFPNNCGLEISEVPVGTYELVVWGKGCDLGFCEEDSVSLGEHTLNDLRGVCVPLVPPSSDQYCETNFPFSEINVYTELNNYYNLPYNSLGQSDCENTESCRQLKLDNPSFVSSELLVSSDLNAMCKSLGGCGVGSNLLGDTVSGGFVTSEACDAIGKKREDCKLLPPEDLNNIEASKYQNLRSGKPVRPENYFPLFFTIPTFLISRKFKNKSWLFLFFLSLFILTACGAGELGGDSFPPPMQVNCNSWQKPFGSDNCWKCNTTVKDGGLLPDVELMTLDDKPAYVCTKDLCEILGAGCVYVEGIDGSRCEKNFAHEFSVPKIIFTGASYICSSYESSECTNGNYKISSDGSGIEIKGKLNELSVVDINFKTVDKNSNQDIVTNCEYSDKSDMSNLLMLPPPDGVNDISHVLHLTNLIAKDYEFYIQCIGVESELESSIAGVKLSVGESPDTNAPIIRNILPENGNSYSKFEVPTKDVKLFTEGDVGQCRWDGKNVHFDDMGKKESTLADGTKNVVYENIFTCTDGGNAKDDSNICNVVLQGVKEGENKFWFSCRGTNGKASDPWPSEGYIIKGSQKLEIVNVRCEHSLGTNCDKIYDSKFNFAIDTIGGAKDGEAGCKWGVGNYALDVFDEPGGDLIEGPKYAKIHKETEFSHETGTILVKFRCEDIAGNTAENEVTINIEQDITPPKINKVYRYGNELRVQTSELSTCYYLTDPKASFDENTPKFSSSDNLEHSAAIESNNNFYKIRCEDRFTNKKETSVYLSKL